MTKPTKREWTGGEWEIAITEEELVSIGCHGSKSAIIYLREPNKPQPFAFVIADVWGGDKIVANAHILAAAPQLFEALYEAALSVQHLVGADEPVWVKNARAALSAALGEGE